MSNQQPSAVPSGVIDLYQSWSDIRVGLEPGEVIHVGKDVLPHPCDVGMTPAVTSVSLRRVYCDHKEKQSLRVYDYGDQYRAKVVKYNPDAGLTSAVAHAVFDVPEKTALALSVGYGAYRTLGSNGQARI